MEFNKQSNPVPGISKFLLKRYSIHICTVYLFNSLATKLQYNVAHFCRFLALLEYILTGVKFLPTTALCAMYNVKEETGNF